jgi:hypothetical protein
MNKVVTINLNGKPYQFEEAGYRTLRSYLAQMEAALRRNAGKERVEAAFEQVIAEKLDADLSPGKSTLTERDVAQTISELGPVGSGANALPGTQANPERIAVFTRVGSAVFFLLSSIALGILVLLWIAVLVSIASTGLVFDNVLIAGASPITTAIFVTALFLIAFLPLQSLTEESYYHVLHTARIPSLFERVGRVCVWLFAFLVIFSIGYQYIPSVHREIDVARGYVPAVTFPQQ